MKWGLTQGMIGRTRESLAPSLAATGPNIYLDRTDFFKMFGAAFVVHGLVFLIASLMPAKEVTNIPVRALSFKLGDQDRIAAYAPSVAPAPQPEVSAPVMQASSGERISATPQPVPPPAPEPKPEPKPLKPQKIDPLLQPKPKQTYTPSEQYQQPAPPPLAALPAAIASTPQQYVREVGQVPMPAPQPQQAAPTQGTPQGAVGGQGNVNIQTEQTSREIRDRYEQQISGWIKRHQVYPAEAGGRTGRVVIRMRIDRGGTVRYYALEESSGIQALDLAALDMIRRANPMPMAPVNYPAGSLIEFLIPINFRP